MENQGGDEFSDDDKLCMELNVMKQRRDGLQKKIEQTSWKVKAAWGERDKEQEEIKLQKLITAKDNLTALIEYIEASRKAIINSYAQLLEDIKGFESNIDNECPNL